MNYDEIKKLINDMGNAQIDELKIEFPEGMKISMKKNTEKEVRISNENTTSATSSEIINNQNNTKTLIKEENTQQENYKIIESPMVGTFYSRPAPNKETFVKIGENVKKGQVICIVEAMKLMNEIESEFDGKIAEICVKDGDLVEYGTALFKLK